MALSYPSNTPCYVRQTHPAGFRSGQWAKVTDVRMVLAPQGNSRRPCFLVEFVDGRQDFWPVDDRYQFSSDPGA